MAQPKKTEEEMFSTHLQVCLKPDFASAFREYADEEHDGNQSAAAREVLREYLLDMGYMKDEGG